MESTKRQIKDMEEKVALYHSRIQATPKVEEQYNSLTIEQQNTQAKYTDLMRKYMEARVAHGLEKDRKGERFTLIDPARNPEKPIKPNRLAILLIGFVLGIGAGVGTAALREYSDDSVRDVRRLASATSFRVLAAIPEIATKGDKLRKGLVRVFVTAGVLVVVAGGLTAFHFQVMDLGIFWNKLVTKLSLLFL